MKRGDSFPHIMKALILQSPARHRKSGFSLIEMIGVLAIIAILVAVVLPKVFSTIASSRVTHAASSITTVRSAVTEFAGKYGTLPTTNGNSRIDDLLVAAGFLDTRIALKIGTKPSDPPIAGATWTNSAGTWSSSGGSNQNSQSRITSLISNTANPATANGRNFQLDGSTDLPAGARVVAAVIRNCTGSEALELSQRLDGDNFSEADATTADDRGRVVYNTPSGAGITNAYVYIVHQ